MKISETLSAARYVVDPDGNKTEVLIPIETWKQLLAAWERLVEMIEDQEDRALFTEWLEQRARDEIKTISLEDLERELAGDDSLPG